MWVNHSAMANFCTADTTDSAKQILSFDGHQIQSFHLFILLIGVLKKEMVLALQVF